MYRSVQWTLTALAGDSWKLLPQACVLGCQGDVHWLYGTTLVDWLTPALVQRPEYFHSLLRAWNLISQVYGTLAGPSWQQWRWQQQSPLLPHPGASPAKRGKGQARPGAQAAISSHKILNAVGGKTEDIALVTKASRNVKARGECDGTEDNSEIRIQKAFWQGKKTRRHSGLMRMDSSFKFREEVEERSMRPRESFWEKFDLANWRL